MNNLRIVTIFMWLALVGLATGQTQYVFEVAPPFERDFSSYLTTNSLPPVDGERVLVFVTKAQYEAGFEALPASVVAQAVADAKDYEADHANWEDRKLKALAKVLLSEINILRQKAGLPARTGADVKAAIKSRLAE